MTLTAKGSNEFQDLGQHSLTQKGFYLFVLISNPVIFK